MANPKRKHSKSRTMTRRSTWITSAPQLGPCPQCREPKLAHRVCPNCGYYSGRQAIEIAAGEEEA